jgi:hypothetical protein
MQGRWNLLFHFHFDPSRHESVGLQALEVGKVIADGARCVLVIKVGAEDRAPQEPDAPSEHEAPSELVSLGCFEGVACDALCVPIVGGLVRASLVLIANRWLIQTMGVVSRGRRVRRLHGVHIRSQGFVARFRLRRCQHRMDYQKGN